MDRTINLGISDLYLDLGIGVQVNGRVRLGKIVAYGHTEGPVNEDRPYIPDLLVIRSVEGSVWSIGRSEREAIEIGEDGLQKIIKSGRVSTSYTPKEWFSTEWIIVEEKDITSFPLTEEDEVRARRSKQLLAEAESVKGDPIRKLSLLHAAGVLARMGLSSVVSVLESTKDPSESLSDAFLRTKK